MQASPESVIDPVPGPAQMAGRTDGEASVPNRMMRTGPFLLAASDGRHAVGEAAPIGEETSTTTAPGAFN